MNKKAFITGVTGQDGSYLAEFLLDKGYQVHGLKRRSSSFNTARVDHIFTEPYSGKSDFLMHYGDLTDTTNLVRLIEEIRPDEIYNLAAQSHVQVSFETPEYTANSDALGVTRILEAIRILDMAKSTKFYQASSSEMFGLTNTKEALNEESMFYPRSPYGIAKLYAYWMTVNYREAYGFHASNGILFNHESPRRGETFVTRKIVRAAVKIKKGTQSTLFLGNLNSIRDWGHAKDYVDGMWRIMQAEKAEDFVIATGNAISVRDFCEHVFSKLGIQLSWFGNNLEEKGKDQFGNTVIQIDPRYFRPTEVPFLLGDATKAREKLGWSPKYTLEMLIDEMIEAELEAFGKIS